MPKRQTSLSGFTLVEILVAIAVLTIIMVAVSQIVGIALNLTTSGNNQLDASNQARTLFDRMTADVSRMVKRSDIDYVFNKGLTNNSDQMFFFSEGPASSGDVSDQYTISITAKNSVSLVGYRINTTYQAERLGKPYQWDNSNGNFPSVPFITYGDPTDLTKKYSGLVASNASTPTPLTTTPGGYSYNYNATAAADKNFHLIGNQIFRLEITFLLKDGTQANEPLMLGNTLITAKANSGGTGPPSKTDDLTSAYSAGSRWWDAANQIGYICTNASQGNATWQQIGVQDIAAIVVTIAVLNNQGVVIAQKSGFDLSNLAKQFSTVSDANLATNISVASTWTAKLTTTTNIAAVSGASGLPKPVISQIRIFQRYIYVN